MPQQSLVDSLPQEIIDKILDNFSMQLKNSFSDSGLKDLRTCSLVCRAFTPRCQQHIFSTLRFSDLESEDGRKHRTRQKIYKMMLTKPHIADGVRRVSIRLGSKGMKAVVDEEDLTEPGLLLSLRERTITSIAIHSRVEDEFEDEEENEDEDENEDENENEDADADVIFNPSPSDIEEYFIRPFIQATFITSLEITFTTIRPSLFACFPNLAELSLTAIIVDLSGDHGINTAQQPRAQLRTLYLSDLSKVISKEILGLGTSFPLLDISQLRMLDSPLCPLENDMLVLDRVFGACAQSLEELKLHGSFHKDETSWKIYNLSCFPKLTMLHLLVEFSVEHDRWFVFNPFIDHCRLLATIPSPNKLEYVSIDIHMACPEAISPLHCLNVPGWDELDYQFGRISDSSDKTLDVNLYITWAILRPDFIWDRTAFSSSEPLRENVMNILRTTFTQAMQQKFRRVNQSPRIHLKIIHGRCIIVE